MHLPRPVRGAVRGPIAQLDVSEQLVGIICSDGAPVHGHYCGPGHGDSSYRTPPRDPVDAVCMEHDKCYDDKGYLHCDCDRELLSKMPGAIAAPGSDEPAKLAGVATIGWFATSPCDCKREVCVNVPFCNIRGCGVRRECQTIHAPGIGGHGPGCG